MKLVDQETHLELKYYRLSHTRALKESYRFNIWQAQTFLGPAPKDTTAGFVDRGDGVFGLQVTGKDDLTSIIASKSMFSMDNPTIHKIEFDTINLAQIPSYLLISVPKLNESYSLAANGRFQRGVQPEPKLEHQEHPDHRQQRARCNRQIERHRLWLRRR